MNKQRRDSRHTIRLDEDTRNMLFAIIHERSKNLGIPITVCSVIDDGIKAIWKREVSKKGKEHDKELSTTVRQSVYTEN